LASCGPILLRRPSRRFLRRLVFVGALAGTLFVAPGASGLPAAVDAQPTIIGTLGAGGWYLSNVTVRWTISGETGSEGCATQTISVDTPGTRVTCRAWNDTPPGEPIEEEVSKTVTIKLDKTPPVASVALERQPDANGWYNHPFTVAWVGSDVTSGLAGCSSARYAGPDSGGGALSGSCTDRAGNVAGSAYAFKYDATPPAIFAVDTKPGNRSVEVSWRASADTQLVEIFRAPGRNGQGEGLVYRGTERGFRDTGLTVGRSYEYRLRGLDAAANPAEQAIKIVATGALLSPAPGARVSLKALPTLVWTPVKKTSYYNLQLVRVRRVLSTWPVRPGFRLRRTWTYRGRRYSLRPGVYRWYVWPGKGKISAGKYGRLLGSSTFVVTK
jgi:hypothetical protein